MFLSFYYLKFKDDESIYHWCVLLLVICVENSNCENSTADSDDKLACHLSYTHLFPECAEDLLSWQNGATEESKQISMQGLRF